MNNSNMENFNDLNLDQSIKNILTEGESIKWAGRPDLSSLIFSSILRYGIFLLIVLIVVFIFLNGSNSQNSTCVINGVSYSGAEKCGTTFKYITYVFIIIIIFNLFKVINSFFSSKYAISDKRVIIKSGFFGLSLKSIYFNKIKDVVLDTGIIGRFFSTGTIKINTGEVKYVNDRSDYNSGRNNNVFNSDRIVKITNDLLSIKDANMVYQILQKSVLENKESNNTDSDSNINSDLEKIVDSL